MIWRPIRDWWMIDCVRVSPADGKLLRVRPGDLITIAGRDLQVMTRRAHVEADSISLQLTFENNLACETNSDVITLLANLDFQGRPLNLSLLGSQTIKELTARDLQVWSRHGDVRST